MGIAMNGPRHQLFAGTGFTKNQYCGIGAGHLADHLGDFDDFRRFPDDLILTAVNQRLFRRLDFWLAGQLITHSLVYSKHQPFNLKRLGDILIGPFFHGLDRVLR